MKRNIYARMWRDLFYGQPIAQYLGTFRHVNTTPLDGTVVIDDLMQVFRDAAGITEKSKSLGDLLREKIEHDQKMAELVEPVGKTYLNMQDIPVSVPIEAQTSGLTKYVVAKKSTGEVVGEFDLLEEAQAMIDKAKRAKKAALVLINEDAVA
jgi:hypothetical protein